MSYYRQHGKDMRCLPIFKRVIGSELEESLATCR